MTTLFCVRDVSGGDEGAGASEERTSTEAKRTPKQPDPGDFWIGLKLENLQGHALIKNYISCFLSPIIHGTIK
jgi:hypothetical protein